MFFCVAVYYCSKKSQQGHYSNHKAICLAVDHLHQKFWPSSQNSQFTSHVTPREHANLISLVGSRCLVSGLIDGIAINGLWNSGSQVSTVSKHCVEKFLVGKEVRPISDLLDEVDLKLCAANGTDIPFLGWISCEVQVKNLTESLSVPFIVSKKRLITHL